MKKNLFYFIFINLAFFVSSCSEDSDNKYEYTPDEQTEVGSNELIDKNSIDISTDDARKISAIFGNSQPKLKSSIAKSISEIKTQYDSEGKPTMYVVNYSNNGGFIIISATKNYQPILAFSDNGNFDTSNLQDGPKEFYSTYNSTLEQINNEVIDSLRIKFAADWAIFEQPDAPSPEVKSSPVDRQAEIAKWQAKGYECHSLNAVYSFLPSDKAALFIRDICSNYHPSFDCMTTAIFLIKRFQESTGKLTQTAWGQGAPFNINASNELAGCTPIAMAQIMRFHKWPTSYTWELISEAGTASSETHRFILDVRNRANVTYEAGVTLSDYVKAKNAFNTFNYTAVLYDYYGSSDIQRIAGEVKARRPVYMSGNRSGENVGHAWVCEGYKVNKIQYSAVMIGNEMISPSGGIEYMHYTGTTETTNQYFYMNWGWKGRFDGWFSLGNAGHDITHDPSDNENPYNIEDYNLWDYGSINYKGNMKYITVKDNR